MPVRYRFDSNIVVIELVGEYSMDDLRAAILNSLADPALPAGSCLLVDTSESLSIKGRSADEIRAMADFVGTLGKHFNNRIALVAPDDWRFGLMRMVSIGSEQWGINSRAFRTFAEAKEWMMSSIPPAV